MRGLLIGLFFSGILNGCGCNENITGDPDATDTTAETEGDPTGDLDCGDCDDLDPCTTDSCDSFTGECIHDPLDVDGDGFPAMVAPDGTTCDGTDCDDTDDTVYPGAPEVCMDGVDQDCDTIIDGPRAMWSTVHLKTLDSGGSNPDLVWTGSEFVAVWDDDHQTRINMARVGLDGEVIGEVVNLVDATSMSPQIGHPSLEWTGSELGIVYSGGEILVSGESASWDIFMFRASPMGEIIHEAPRLNDVDTTAWVPTMVWTGSQFGVAWRDGRDDTCATYDTCLYETYFTRLDASATEIGSETRITDVAESAVHSHDTPLWTGSEFILKWAEIGSTSSIGYFSRIDGDGARVGADVELTYSGTGSTWTGSEIGSIWQSDESGNHEIYFVRMDPLGSEIGEPVRITDAPHFSGHSDLIWTGSDYAVVWLDARDTGCDGPPTIPGDCNRDLFFNILDPEGTKLWDDVKITIRETWVINPTLAWTGSEFGLSWLEYSDASGYTELAVSFDVISFCD